MVTGRINSFQSFGTLDGPGVRAVVFMQGCPLRCICCHNPETWDNCKGIEITTEELLKKILRCKNYFGDKGGATISGGEPLLQAKFLLELFSNLKAEKINIALDTSGCILNDDIKKLLSLTDLVILDYKYTNDADYKKYTGCDKENVDIFLSYLNSINKETWIRTVIIEKYNDSPNSVKKLSQLREKYSCITKIELLPFRKLCLEKYKMMQIPFLLESSPETNSNTIIELEKYLG